MALKWKDVLALKGASWGLSAKEISDFNDLTLEAQTSLAVVESNECTKLARTQCRTDFAALVAKMEDIKKRHFFSPPLTALDFKSLGLDVPDGSHTHVEVLDEEPALTIKPGEFRQLLFSFKVASTDSKAIPYGHNGAVLYWKKCNLGDPAPTSVKELTESELHSVSHFDMWFDEEDRGKIVYFSICWENESSQKGPPSIIQSAIIP